MQLSESDGDVVVSRSGSDVESCVGSGARAVAFVRYRWELSSHCIRSEVMATLSSGSDVVLEAPRCVFYSVVVVRVGWIHCLSGTVPGGRPCVAVSQYGGGGDVPNCSLFIVT